MLEGSNKNNNSKVLDSLISELRRPLTLIARQAELHKSQPEDNHLRSIQKTAEETLKLIDSYLLTAQSEYGQQLLPVESFAAGSVIYDVAEEIRPAAKKANIEVVTDVNDALVLANRGGLEATIWCLSNLVLAGISSPQAGALEITSKKSANFLKISVLNRSVNIKNSDFHKVRSNLGKRHMALSSSSSETGVRLAIADMLGESLGTKLRAIKVGDKRGIGFDLALSSQLRLGLI